MPGHHKGVDEAGDAIQKTKTEKIIKLKFGNGV